MLTCETRDPRLFLPSQPLPASSVIYLFTRFLGCASTVVPASLRESFSRAGIRRIGVLLYGGGAPSRPRMPGLFAVFNGQSEDFSLRNSGAFQIFCRAKKKPHNPARYITRCAWIFSSHNNMFRDWIGHLSHLIHTAFAENDELCHLLGFRLPRCSVDHILHTLFLESKTDTSVSENFRHVSCQRSAQDPWLSFDVLAFRTKADLDIARECIEAAHQIWRGPGVCMEQEI
jgi:hypothetical protein